MSEQPVPELDTEAEVERDDFVPLGARARRNADRWDSNTQPIDAGPWPAPTTEDEDDWS